MRNLLSTTPIITLLLTLISAGPCLAQSDVQKLLATFYPAPDQIRVESSEASPLVKLQPYVSLSLGKENEPFKWILNKKPPVYIGQYAKPGKGAIIAVVIPPLAPEDFNSRFEAIMRKKFLVLENREYTELSPVKGHAGHFQMELTGTVAEGKRKGKPSYIAGRLIYTDRFCVQVQCVAETADGLATLTEILNSVRELPADDGI